MEGAGPFRKSRLCEAEFQQLFEHACASNNFGRFEQRLLFDRRAVDAKTNQVDQFVALELTEPGADLVLGCGSVPSGQCEHGLLDPLPELVEFAKQLRVESITGKFWPRLGANSAEGLAGREFLSDSDAALALEQKLVATVREGFVLDDPARACDRVDGGEGTNPGSAIILQQYHRDHAVTGECVSGQLPVARLENVEREAHTRKQHQVGEWKDPELREIEVGMHRSRRYTPAAPGESPALSPQERLEQVQVLARLRRDAELLAARFGLSLSDLSAERPVVRRRYGICYEDGSIRIRLRHAKTGALLKYSSLIDTLCHELAHLRHFNHGRQFETLYRQILSYARRVGIYRPALRTTRTRTSGRPHPGSSLRSAPVVPSESDQSPGVQLDLFR